MSEYTFTTFAGEMVDRMIEMEKKESLRNAIDRYLVGDEIDSGFTTYIHRAVNCEPGCALIHENERVWKVLHEELDGWKELDPENLAVLDQLDRFLNDLSVRCYENHLYLIQIEQLPQELEDLVD